MALLVHLRRVFEKRSSIVQSVHWYPISHKCLLIHFSLNTPHKAYENCLSNANSFVIIKPLFPTFKKTFYRMYMVSPN